MESKKSVDADPSMCCCWSCNEDLLRLQSLLSFVGPLEDSKGLVLDFLCSAKDQIPNWLSLEVMCSNEARAIKLLMGMAPKALLPFATETFKDDNEKWSMLFTFLHEHMKNIPEEHPNIVVYSQTFYAVLRHLAEHLNPVEFLALLPKAENPVFLPHVRRCVEKHQAKECIREEGTLRKFGNLPKANEARRRNIVRKQTFRESLWSRQVLLRRNNAQMI